MLVEWPFPRGSASWVPCRVGSCKSLTGTLTRRCVNVNKCTCTWFLSNGHWWLNVVWSFFSRSVVYRSILISTTRSMHVVCVLVFVAINLFEKSEGFQPLLHIPLTRLKSSHTCWMIRCVMSVMEWTVGAAMLHTSAATSTAWDTTVSTVGPLCMLLQAPRITDASLRRMETDRGPSTSSRHSHVWCPRHLCWQQQQAAGTDSPSPPPLPLPSPLPPKLPILCSRAGRWY